MRTFLRLAGFLKGHRLTVALAILLGTLTVASNVGLLSVAAYVISAAALQPLLGELALAIYAVRLFSVSRAASRYAERLVSHDVTFRLLANLRTRFYARLVPLAPARLARYRSGDLLARIVKDVSELENVYLRVLSPVAIALLTGLLVFAVLYPFSPLLAAVAVAFLAATGAGVPALVRRLTRGLGRRKLALRAEMESQMVEGVQGVQDVLAFGREGGVRRGVAEVGEELDEVQRRMASITGLQNALGDLAMNLAVISALIIAVPLVAGGEARGVYLAFLAIVVLGAFEAIQPLGAAFGHLGASVNAGERLFEVVDAEPEVRDPGKPAPPPASASLRFEEVGFGYGREPVLRDVSFELEPGRKVAVVGPSGSGKSTLVNLLLRFYDPEKGRVLLGGRDLREYAQEDARAVMGVFTQQVHVFAASLRENLLLANPEANDAALARALERARLSDLVRRLPEGLETRVGEGGFGLSGGERQRLALARALLRDAPLLVLDEPTANLDTGTEREVMEAVREASGQKSVLLITHRLVGLEEMDEVLVLDRGRIVERGTHAELVRRDGLYRRMLEVQRGMFAA